MPLSSISPVPIYPVEEGLMSYQKLFEREQFPLPGTILGYYSQTCAHFNLWPLVVCTDPTCGGLFSKELATWVSLPSSSGDQSSDSGSSTLRRPDGGQESSSAETNNHPQHTRHIPSTRGSVPKELLGTDHDSGTKLLPPKEIYWCVDKSWVEPRQTQLCAIKNVEQLDDSALCTKLAKEYQRVRGWRAKYFSWKTCMSVEFVRVSSQNRLYE